MTAENCTPTPSDHLTKATQSYLDDVPASELDDKQLRRQLANADMVLRLAMVRRTSAHTLEALIRRRKELEAEYGVRGLSTQPA